MGFASMLSQWDSRFTGFMASVDNLPPVFLGFPFAPDIIKDNFNPEFEWVNSPGSRYKYPIYSGGSERIINFQLKFDASYVTVKGDTKNFLFQVGNDNSFANHVRYAQHIEIVVALLEKFKLPKQGPAQLAQGILGAFTKVRPGVSDPAPPLLVLALNPFKIYVGYLGKADIQQIKFDKYMFCTRIIADCSFFVSPDLLATTAEDIKRDVQASLGWLT